MNKRAEEFTLLRSNDHYSNLQRDRPNYFKAKLVRIHEKGEADLHSKLKEFSDHALSKLEVEPNKIMYLGSPTVTIACLDKAEISGYCSFSTERLLNLLKYKDMLIFFPDYQSNESVKFWKADKEIESLSNSGFSRATAPSSVVQTGVKSFG